ncbi:DNA-processing protein DprA [Bacillus horti]|uniref:DNA processing protein n=1 Tax=Caldalkalibacillus horti TaxID=77523 RepID=A0ABT9VUI7_9BACI|nr:DNA-processing protein DprA [Bacillus horti]MDQ0164650.1 DNA processing protein [Bacillus horti]
MDKLFLGLSCTPGVGWSTIHKLLSHGMDQESMGWSQEQWKQHYPFLKDEQCNQLSKHVHIDFLEKLLLELKAKDIYLIPITDPRYPPMLKEIFDPPWLLFAKGSISLLSQPCLSFVGSRKTTKYGIAATVKLVTSLVQQDWCVVSGMALGIDAVSHRVALQEKGATIAVLGSGIDIPYPSQHKQLYEQITQNGLILSEYPPGVRAHPGFFPKRNRIISGISYGTVVIEANKRSGSLITAQLALEQGREVFAVPGSIFDQQSIGTNLLIQQHGAKLVLEHSDITQEFSHLDLNNDMQGNKKRLKIEEKVDDIEKRVLAQLAFEKKHVQELCEELELSFSELSSLLLRLEMKKLVQALPGSYYQSIGS